MGHPGFWGLGGFENRQRQPRVLRLRCSQRREQLAQDDRVSGGVGEKRPGAERVEKLGIANLRAMRRAQDGAPGLQRNRV